MLNIHPIFHAFFPCFQKKEETKSNKLYKLRLRALLKICKYSMSLFLGNIWTFLKLLPVFIGELALCSNWVYILTFCVSSVYSLLWRNSSS